MRGLRGNDNSISDRSARYKAAFGFVQLGTWFPTAARGICRGVRQRRHSRRTARDEGEQIANTLYTVFGFPSVRKYLKLPPPFFLSLPDNRQGNPWMDKFENFQKFNTENVCDFFVSVGQRVHTFPNPWNWSMSVEYTYSGCLSYI